MAKNVPPSPPPPPHEVTYDHVAARLLKNFPEAFSYFVMT